MCIRDSFRPNQAFFKWYGGFYRNMLKNISHFFVQTTESISLLKSIGFDNISLAGDTRFDRVYENAQNPKRLELIETFCNNDKVFIAGSTWSEDEKLLVSLTEKNPDWKFIIAPHEIGQPHIQEIEDLFPKAIKFSILSSQLSENLPQILLIYNIGILSSIYQYAKVCLLYTSRCV